MGKNRHQTQPSSNVVTSDALRRSQLATEALIEAAGASGVTTFNGRYGAVSLLDSDVDNAIGATGGTTNFYRQDGTWAAPGGGGGGGGYSISTKTAAYSETATSGEVIALLDLAAGFTVTLPTAVGNTAKLVFKKMLAAGSMVIDGSGSQTIDGGLTATLTAQYESITLVSTGSNWVII